MIARVVHDERRNLSFMLLISPRKIILRLIAVRIAGCDEIKLSFRGRMARDSFGRPSSFRKHAPTTACACSSRSACANCDFLRASSISSSTANEQEANKYQCAKDGADDCYDCPDDGVGF